jgi:predicted Zn-dependent protease
MQLGAKVLAAGLIAALAALLPAAVPAASEDGVNVGKPSVLRNLVPAEQLERQSAQQYGALKRQAADARALAPDGHPQVQRLRAIARRLIPYATRFNPRADQWRWEINLIGSRQINAFCMPGGKIAFYTGIIESLKLTDDEVAIVMGHEIAHALREHARERLAKSELTQLGAGLLGQVVAGGKFAGAIEAGGSLLTLKFSRDNESEADVVGLDLAARAGFDPRAGVTLWQKMSQAGRGAPPQWLSTHPTGPNRIREIEKHLPEVLPLYEKARASSTASTRATTRR